jgi:hypothetical protein
MLVIQSTVQALLSALSRPAALIEQITTTKREADRSYNSMTRSSRWPLGLLDETRQRMQDEKEERIRKLREEAVYLSKELRYTQQTVASELAGWQSMHELAGRRAIRELARGMLVQERMTLDGMMRALRKLRPDHASENGAQKMGTPVHTQATVSEADGGQDAA